MGGAWVVRGMIGAVGNPFSCGRLHGGMVGYKAHELLQGHVEGIALLWSSLVPRLTRASLGMRLALGVTRS